MKYIIYILPFILHMHICRDMPAKLLEVCLLELSASRKIDPKKSYEIGFRVSLSREWSSDFPIFIMARRGDGHFVARKVSFEGWSLHEEFDIPDKFSVKFLPQDSSADFESYLHIGMYDYWNPDWKRGLNIHHAFAREVNSSWDQEDWSLINQLLNFWILYIFQFQAYTN